MLMDYGQNKQSVLDSDPIADGMTSGVGLQSDHLNVLPTEENLNTDSFSGRDYGLMGNVALKNSGENDRVVAEHNAEPQMNSYPEIELAPPPVPDENEPTTQELTSEPEQTLSTKTYAQFADGKVSIADVKVLQAEEKERDPESFYDFVQKLRETMLEGARHE